MTFFYNWCVFDRLLDKDFICNICGMGNDIIISI